MKTIPGLSGRLRRASFNTGLLWAAAELAPDDARIEIGSIGNVPLYDADLEAADGLPLVTPEYNNGIPGLFKKAIDWMSRGPGFATFVDKPVTVIGASPGGFGPTLA